MHYQSFPCMKKQSFVYSKIYSNGAYLSNRTLRKFDQSFPVVSQLRLFSDKKNKDTSKTSHYDPKLPGTGFTRKYDNTSLSKRVTRDAFSDRTQNVSLKGFENLSVVRFPNPKRQATPEDVKAELRKHLDTQDLRPGETYNPLDLVSRARVGNLYTKREIRRVPRPSRLLVTGKEIHFTNVWLLSRFISPMGRVMPRWRTGLSKENQHKLKKAVRQSRQIGLLPYLHRYSHGPLNQAEGEKSPNMLCCPFDLKKKSQGWGSNRSF